MQMTAYKRDKCGKYFDWYEAAHYRKKFNDMSLREEQHFEKTRGRRGMIRKLIYKMRKRRFCKLNRWFCPDCIYHDFVFEGTIFRGNRCRYPKYRERSEK